MCLTLLLVLPLASLPLHIARDYGEGWNAYWATRAMAGAPLYTGDASAVTNNYPPLSFFLFGGAGAVLGDQIVAGRLLSLVALLACAGGVALAVRRLGGDPRWAAAAAIGFLVQVASFAWRYVASDDPQWLAAAVSLGALLVLLRDDRPDPARLWAASALMLCAGLIKHNQLALPIATTWWLARGRNAAGLGTWLTASAVLVAAALGLLYIGFGKPLFDQVLGHHRVFSLAYLDSALGSLSGLLPALALAGLLWRHVAPGDRRVELVLLFAGVAIMWGLVERLGTGVSVNAHFDSYLALPIVAGVALGRRALLPAAERQRWAALLMLPLVAATLYLLHSQIRRLQALPSDRVAWAAAIDAVRATPGPVPCEMPAICYWAGKPFLLDFYNYGQKLRLVGDPAHLRARIERRAFPAMVVIRDARFRDGDGRLPTTFNRAIAANYRPVLALPDHIILLRPS